MEKKDPKRKIERPSLLLPSGFSRCACVPHLDPSTAVTRTRLHHPSKSRISSFSFSVSPLEVVSAQQASRRPLALCDCARDGRRPGRSGRHAGGGRGGAIRLSAAVVTGAGRSRRRAGVAPSAEGEHRPRPGHRGRVRRTVRRRVRGRGIGTYGALEWSLQ